MITPNPAALLAATRDITLWQYPVSPHGTFCDKPEDMLTDDELRTYILQMRRRYSAEGDTPIRPHLAAGHSRLMAELTRRVHSR